ncbi:MAG: translation elongation factor Ts, partial [Gammaproteobacteria bacterium]|nr:translation elongation factor Ts [Gammaproteobacteria bacterium]
TGAGMMDCKKALAESKGDIEEASDWLRKKGLSAAAKKSGRIAAEGLVGVAAKGTKGAVVEVNAETDFVARNDKFQEFVKTATQIALDAGGDIETLKVAKYPASGKAVADELTTLVATIGENMNLRRSTTLSVNQGVVASYMHNALTPGLGRIGVLVALESAGATAKLQELAHKLSLHVAAANPIALSTGEVPAATVERERNILTEQAQASGRPPEVIAKMVERGAKATEAEQDQIYEYLVTHYAKRSQ